MRRTKEQKAITLIALIITIVVLLILAVVAISAIQNDGILSYAQNTAKDYNQASTNEQSTIQGYLNFLQNGGGNNTIDPDLELLEKFFINEENTIPDASTSLIYLNEGPNDDNTQYNIYFKYNDKAYKVSFGYDSDIAESVELVYIKEGREGDPVEYDSNLDGEPEEWIILTDRNGLVEIVSADARVAENVTRVAPLYYGLILGNEDTRVTATTDLNKDDTVDEIDTQILSYNTAITTINNYCDEIVTATNNSGVRSVGGINNNFTPYSSTNYDNWGKDITVDVASGDMQYEEDLVKMSYFGIVATEEDYWLASRYVYENESGVDFGVFGVIEGTLRGNRLWHLELGGYLNRHGSSSFAVRPVVINPSGI